LKQIASWCPQTGEATVRAPVTMVSFFLWIHYAAKRGKEKEGELQEGGWSPGLRGLKIPHFKLRLAILHPFRVWAFPGECHFSTMLKIICMTL